jgi:glucose-1-phosphate cytidylyltransferase
VDTGDATLTAGRLKRVAEHVRHDDCFCFTYGDGLADIDITRLIAFHRGHGRLATVTAVAPPGRYGALELAGTAVRGFAEKPRGDGGRINGGFLVLSPAVLDTIGGDHSSFESETLPALAARAQLEAFDHDGFWLAMDTVRDRTMLEELWLAGRAPWKAWA